MQEAESQTRALFAKGKEHVKQHRLREPDKSKYEIYNAVKNESGKSKNWQQLQERLAEKGITIQFKYKGQTSEIQGISFSKGEYTFKGSEIDRSFSFSKLDKCFGDAGLNTTESNRQTVSAPVQEPAQTPGKATVRYWQAWAVCSPLHPLRLMIRPTIPVKEKRRKRNDT